MKIKLANKITLTDVPDNMTRKIYDTFTVENQVWLDNKKMNRWNGKTRYNQILVTDIIKAYPIESH